MDPIDAQFAAFSETFEVLEVIGLVFLLIIVSETFWDIFTGKRKNYGETIANFLIGIGNHFLERTLYGLVFIMGLFVTKAFIPYSISYSWWSWVLAVIAADLTYYWMHRWEHEIRFFWAYHSVHHSSTEFNLTTGLRLAWIEGLIEWVFFVPMIFLGFSVVQTIIALAVVVMYQTWIHTEKIGKLGWADRIFNTPSVHRVHHGSNRQYLDKNYGGILILWDRVFGTYQAEEEKVNYGLTYPLGTSNPIMINIHEYWQIIKDVRKSTSKRDAFGYIFGPPGWKPNKK